PVVDAQDYAFHFGRKRGESRGPDESIGVYGIGLKRAIFKIGRSVEIRSSTTEASFEMRILVDEWVDADAWTFPLNVDDPLLTAGTEIRIGNLNPGVGSEFSDPTFVNRLTRS